MFFWDSCNMYKYKLVSVKLWHRNRNISKSQSKIRKMLARTGSETLHYLLLKFNVFRFGCFSIPILSYSIFIRMHACSNNNNKILIFFFFSIHLKRNFILSNSKAYFHNKYSILKIKSKPNQWKITNGHGNKKRNSHTKVKYQNILINREKNNNNNLNIREKINS